MVLPSAAVALPTGLADSLRAGEPPVIGHVTGDRLLLDLAQDAFALYRVFLRPLAKSKHANIFIKFGSAHPQGNLDRSHVVVYFARMSEIPSIPNGFVVAYPVTRDVHRAVWDADGVGHSGEVERRGSDQDGAADSALRSFTNTFACSDLASRPAWICRVKAKESAGNWTTGARFRLVRFRWGRKWA